MNVRKPVDYSVMFTALDTLMAADLPQVELYCEIGRLVSERPEKGAAVAAAEYLGSAYPNISGFSPRNLRRMREFYAPMRTLPKELGLSRSTVKRVLEELAKMGRISQKRQHRENGGYTSNLYQVL